MEKLSRRWPPVYSIAQVLFLADFHIWDDANSPISSMYTTSPFPDYIAASPTTLAIAGAYCNRHQPCHL
uniref:hypothetical protein n=1 Tax=uncultured Pseudomonas sp. TaxID=114707 RepID=UPI0025907C83